MTDFNTDIKNEAYRIRLTEAERSRIRARILANAPRPIASPYASVFAYFTYSRGLAVAFSFVLVISGAGGTLYASGSALPGDALYTIKTGVAEPLSGVFAVSKKAETEWHAKIATTRLTEAEELAKEGRLDEETSATLALAFREHADAVETEVADDESNAHEDADHETARESFAALVAAKGASILEATDTDDAKEGRIASANFVLSVLDDERHEEAIAADTAVSSRMAKSAVPEDAEPVALMMASVPADAALMIEAQSTERIVDLAKRAKTAFSEARERAGDGASLDTRRELAASFRILVRAEAERAAGNEDAARALYDELLARVAALRPEGEVKGWMDSGDSREEDSDLDERGWDRDKDSRHDR